MNPNTTRFVTTEIDDSAGSLAAATSTLASEGVAIDLMTCTGGQVTILPTNVETTVRVLQDAGLDARVTEFVSVTAPTGTGQLQQVLEALGEAGVNLGSCILTANQLYVACPDPAVAIRAFENVGVATV